MSTEPVAKAFRFVNSLQTSEQRDALCRGIVPEIDLHTTFVSWFRRDDKALTTLAPNGARDKTRTREPSNLLLLNAYARKPENTARQCGPNRNQ